MPKTRLNNTDSENLELDNAVSQSSNPSITQSSSLLKVPEVTRGKHSRESSGNSSHHSDTTITDIDAEEAIDVRIIEAEGYQRELLELTLVDTRSTREKLQHFINALEVDLEKSKRNEFTESDFFGHHIPQLDRRLTDFSSTLANLKDENERIDEERITKLLPSTKERLESTTSSIDLTLENLKTRFPKGFERVDPDYVPLHNMIGSRDYLLHQCTQLFQTEASLKSFDLDLIVNYLERYKQSTKPWIDPTIGLLTDKERVDQPQPLQNEPFRVLQVVEVLQSFDFLLNELPRRVPAEHIDSWINSLKTTSEDLLRLENGISPSLPWENQKNWLGWLAKISNRIKPQITGILNLPILPETRDIPESFIQLELDTQKRFLGMQEKLLRANPIILKQSLESQYHLLNAQISLQTNILKRNLKDRHIKLLHERNFDALKKSSSVLGKQPLIYMVDSLRSWYAQLSACRSLWTTIAPLQESISLTPSKQPEALLLLRLQMLSKKGAREGANRLTIPVIDELGKLKEQGELTQEDIESRRVQSQKELNIKWTLICLTRLTENAVRQLPEEKQQIEDGLFEQLREQADLTSEEVNHFKSLQRQDRRNFRKNVEITYMPESLEALEKIRTELHNHEEKLKLMTPLGKKPDEKNVVFSDTSQMAQILDTEDEPEVSLGEGSSTENVNTLARVDSVMDGQIQEEKADTISIAPTTKSIVSISDTVSIHTQFDKDQRYPQSVTKSGDHAKEVTEQWELKHTDEIIRQAKTETAVARELAREAKRQAAEIARQAEIQAVEIARQAAERVRQEEIKAGKIKRWEDLERNQPPSGGEINLGSKFSSNTIFRKGGRRLSKEMHKIGLGEGTTAHYRLPEGSTHKLLESSSTESPALDPAGPFKETARPPVGHPALEKLAITKLDELPFHWLPDDGRRSIPPNSCVFYIPAAPNAPDASFLFRDRQQNLIIRVPADRIDTGRKQELLARLPDTTPEQPYVTHGQFSCVAMGRAVPTGVSRTFDSIVKGRRY